MALVVFKNSAPVPRPMRILAASLLLLVLASGCVIPSKPATTGAIETAPAQPAVDASTYRITLDWVVASVQANQSFSFPMHVDGNVSATSTHIGAHYWTSSQAAPSASNALRCEHMAGEQRVPNDFTVTCTPAAPGRYFIRGHVQMTRGSQVLDWWSPEHQFDVHA